MRPRARVRKVYDTQSVRRLIQHPLLMSTTKKTMIEDIWTFREAWTCSDDKTTPTFTPDNHEVQAAQRGATRRLAKDSRGTDMAGCLAFSIQNVGWQSVNGMGGTNGARPASRARGTHHSRDCRP
jgi:hypothetical protein